MDTNGDGQLDPEELQHVFEACGRGFITVPVIASFIDDFDHDGNGKLSFPEFLRVWNSTSTHPVLMQAMREGVQELARAPKKTQIGDSRYVLHPYAPFNAEWELYFTFLLAVTVILLPISLAFEQLGCRLRWINLFIDLCFIADIFKHFNTGFVDEEGVLIMDRRMVAWHYAKRCFIVDVVSSFPYDMFNFNFSLSCGSDDLAYAKATRLLKLVRLFRIMKIFRLLRFSTTVTKMRSALLHYEDKYHISLPESLIKMSQLFGLLLLGAHWIGCLQFMVAAEAGFPKDSWVKATSLHDAPVGRQYIWSYYKALSQMILIGFEVPSAVNQRCDSVTEWCAIEHWLTLACLYLGAIFYSLLISNISMILLSSDVGARNYRDKLQQINEYMRSKGLPAALRDKVKEYYLVQYAEGKMFDEEKILCELTPSLRNEVLYHNMRDLFAKVPLLATFPPALTKAIVSRLEVTVALEGDAIFFENASGDRMYFIYTGVFDISQAGVLIESIADGCYFGDCAVVIGCARTATVTSTTVSISYAITRNGLNAALERAPNEILAYIQLVARSRYERMQHYRNQSANADSEEMMLLEDQEDFKTEIYRDALRQHMEEEAGDDNFRDGELVDGIGTTTTPAFSRFMSMFCKQPIPPATNRIYIQRADDDYDSPPRKDEARSSSGSAHSQVLSACSSPTHRHSRERQRASFIGKFKPPETYVSEQIVRIRRLKRQAKSQHPDYREPKRKVFQRTLKARQTLRS
ncbi:hypothetical protein CTAYLR_007770 [Chrysophaeum taylorii]|uniref:Calmodulin n=1 Tax=Chrysophaeum taylorii TaxID=2483200 RepID=A0AAD7UMA6_9STRA|nr:hypothetical protein CTAYLR_007770 [Chrysophaeum taylorii]